MPGHVLRMVEASITRDGTTATACGHYLFSVAMSAEPFAAAVRAHCGLRTACTAYSTSTSTRIVRETDEITGWKSSHSAKAGAQGSPNHPAGHLNQKQSPALRMVRRVRPLRARSNAIGLLRGGCPLGRRHHPNFIAMSWPFRAAL